ncbi:MULTISPECIES: PRD domain-containing protein [Oceanotoga]|jgi:transcriptional antiterminator|uniref:PRD domain-containing protein n=1 Tax=Oceanotoga TaxID=1255275 RepID=UPI0026545C5C|nr:MULTISPECIES: PRD domain-containing protein [Oceanotoga]MDN5342510.1 transcriptional antiterminator [Oceanotoga sp.]MDO7977490.1 PRD domain-containing protein [Oceanotoga teriensis]
MIMSGEFEILKIINNNVVLAREINYNREMIVIGKGVGFGKKVKGIYEFKPGVIEKSYISKDDEIKSNFFKLMDQLDSDVIGVTEEIIALGEKRLGRLNAHIHIALTDHISFAIDRLKEGLIIENPFLFEIKTMYPEEYEVAQEAADLIKERLNMEISPSEKGFIAMHLNSARQDKMIMETLKDTRVVKDVIELINQELSIKIQEDEMSYSRLLTHLKYVISIINDDKNLENPLLSNIKKEFKKSFKIAEKVTQYLEKELNIKLSEHEIGYLALHIERIDRLKTE